MSEELQTPEWVDAFRNAILELDTAIAEFMQDDPSPEEAAFALLTLNVAKAEVGAAYDYMAGLVGKVMGDLPEIPLPGGGSVEKKYASSRTGWQHKELAATVAQRIRDLSVDMDTGEVLLSQEEMIAQLLDYVQPSYWRVKELQRINVNVDHYCTTGDTKTSIIVRKGTNK
jgi:hypothetical protein